MQITVPSRVVVRGLTAIALAFALATLAGYAYKSAHGSVRSSGLIRLLDVDEESSIPTWFSIVILLFSSGLLAVIGAASRAKHRPDAVSWYGLAIVFLGLSIDEGVMIHEMFETAIGMVVHSQNPRVVLWIIPYLAFAALVLAMCWRFLNGLPARTRRSFLVAGGVYVTGAAVLQVISLPYERLHGSMNLTFLLLSTTEELLEMLGVILFISALLGYVREHVGEVRFSIEDERRRRGSEDGAGGRS